jgi:hypothetical protein
MTSDTGIITVRMLCFQTLNVRIVYPIRKLLSIVRKRNQLDTV